MWHFAYLSNFYFFLIQDWNGPVSHFWSLAVEEQFYLIWPTIILFAPRKMISPLVMATIGVGIFSRYGLATAFPEVRFISLLPTSALVSLGLGAGLACYKANLIGKRFIGLIGSGIPVYIALLVLQKFDMVIPFHGSLMDLFLMLGFTWLVCKASEGFQGVIGRLLSFSVLIYLGKISYGLYVLHNFAGIPVSVFTEMLGLPFLKYGFSGIILKTIFTVVGASLSWHFFEHPINRFKSRFPYRSQQEISDAEQDGAGNVAPRRA